MNTSRVAPLDSSVEGQEGAGFLYIGDEISGGSTVRASRPDEPPTAIVLTGRIEPPELAVALEQVPDPALPIADFGNNRGLRRDFVGDCLDSSALADARRQFAPHATRRSRPDSLQNPKRRLNIPSSAPRPAHVASWKCWPTSICYDDVISPALTNVADAVRQGSTHLRHVLNVAGLTW